MTDAKQTERLWSFGVSPESAARLARKAEEAKRILGIHDVSVSAARPDGAASSSHREAVEQAFRVHETPTRADPLHCTVELPEPVTEETARRFNRLFGRAE